MTTARSRKQLTAIIAAVLMVLVTSVTVGYVIAAPQASHESAAESPTTECTPIDLPMVDIPADGADEPRLRIPQPPGWTPTAKYDHADEAFRFTLVKADAGTVKPHSDVTVMLERHDGADAETTFDKLGAGMADMLRPYGVTGVESTAGTVCGLPARTFTAADSMKAMHVLTEACGTPYLVSVMTAVEPGNVELRREVETILAGFQVLPANAGLL